MRSHHLVLAFVLGGAALTLAGTGQAKSAGTASAALATADGTAAGTATLTQTSKGLRLVIAAKGLSAGVHGLHIHTVGRCDGPDFATAGGHWNPTMAKHGKDAMGGPHEGDLPNLTIATNGEGKLQTLIPGAALTGGEHPLLDADGAAIVIHAAADDYKTDPSGNSGARIVCGVFTAQ